MTPSDDERRSPAIERRKVLEQRVALLPSDPDVAYVPQRVLVRGERAAARVRLLPEVGEPPGFDHRPPVEGEPWIPFDRVADPLATVELLRADGEEAQLEHVFFAHPCDPCAWGAHPSMRFWPELLGADPLRGNPLRGNPLRGNPLRGNPLRGNPLRGNEALLSSARPASDRELPVRGLPGGGGRPRITVLDTGLAGGTDAAGGVDVDGQRPALLRCGANDPERIAGALDLPDAAIAPVAAGAAKAPSDGWLDPVAGHGTFIVGLIEQIAPGCRVLVRGVIGPLGDAREVEVSTAIREEAAKDVADRPHILSLSFGGQVLGQAAVLRGAVAAARAAGIVVVASAGNDGSPLPQYPAAFEHVVAVGAIGPDGPPEWTNYGGWVDACAPGVDLVSAFFNAFSGASPMINTLDPDDFAAWARWSGTSFSAPVVVAALAREMVLGTCTAAVAVDRVIRGPHLLRIPCLGTVVNI